MRPPINLAVLISGSGRTLQNFVDQINAGKLNAKILIVISSVKNAYGLERAKNHHIPIAIVDRKLYKSDVEFSDKITYYLDQYKPELITLAGFLHFYKIPERYKWKVINIHPALLPDFGGKGFYGEKVHKGVLKSGAKESGCTVHFADNLYDHGPIILQRKVPILKDDTPQTLGDRIFKEECIAYPEAIKLFAEGRLEVINNKAVVK